MDSVYPSESHAVGVAVCMGAVMNVTLGRWVVNHFAHRYDTCRASIYAQGTAGTYIVINNENCVVSRIQTGEVGIYSFVYCLNCYLVNAFPRTNIDAPFALDAF